jgi:hypothetical protein
MAIGDIILSCGVLLLWLLVSLPLGCIVGMVIHLSATEDPPCRFQS